MQLVLINVLMVIAGSGSKNPMLFNDRIGSTISFIYDFIYSILHAAFWQPTQEWYSYINKYAQG